ncbi:MAG: DedA family protein [Actinomycetes bacterium]
MASVLSHLFDAIQNLPPLAVYLVVGALVFSEAAIFIGFLFPGETAVIIGGVSASDGHVNIVALCTVVVICAIAGDTVGYWVGKTHGDRLLEMKILRHRRAGLDRGLGLLRTRGAVAVFLGRFTAFLRAVVPGLAGMSGLHYPTFLAANALGGVVWGIGFTLLGYFVGHAYKTVEQYAGWASYAILAFVITAAVTLHIRSKRREKTEEAIYEATHAAGEPKL